MSRRRARDPSDLAGAVRRVEELVAAAGVPDAFEETLRLVAAMTAGDEPAPKTAADVARGLAKARARVPALTRVLRAPRAGAVLVECARLLAPHVARGSGLVVADAAFEHMTSRVAKGEKGQFFTPRHVVELAVRCAAPQNGETVLDPSAGSGAFLWHAAAHASVTLRGIEIDPRAAQAASLLLALAGAARADVRVADGLWTKLPRADVVLSNPPFAGEIVDPTLLARFAVAEGRARVERDVLFLERAVRALAPGGRLCIVLPQRTLADSALAGARRFLVEHCRVAAVIGLCPSTFMPHTQQRTALVVAVRRQRPRPAPPADERVLFAVSERSGVSRRGAPVTRAGARAGSAWDTLDHDLAELVPLVRERVLSSEGAG